MKDVFKKYSETSLILRIFIGLVIGAALGLAVPGWTGIGILGSLFVGALKSIAPILVFVLVLSSLSSASMGIGKQFRTVITLYMVSTLAAALVAVAASFMFPVTMLLGEAAQDQSAPVGIVEVLRNLITNAVSNPIASMANANYIGILFWAVILGLSMKSVASEGTKKGLVELSDGVSQVVRWIINMAPFGIMGLVFSTVSENGLSIFKDYGMLLAVLVGSMFFTALVVNPIIVFVVLRRNPFPLVFRCLKESGLTAFFTRSSAANIPINMELCARLGLDKDMYSVSIPLGATINMDGAAVTITIMTLATVHTMGIAVDLPTAFVLSVLATLGACGASGVAGGSLLLIPMACSLFGISNDVAMQVVSVGFIIGVIQDSVETALNSSGDVLFAATAEFKEWIKEGKELPF